MKNYVHNYAKLQHALETRFKYLSVNALLDTFERKIQGEEREFFGRGVWKKTKKRGVVLLDAIREQRVNSRRQT